MIGPFKKKSELPEYLAHYGMFRAPFSSTLEDDMYYDEPTRKQRLDLILHLIQYTSELLVVIGAKGIGKTMFLRQLPKHAGEHWKLCFIDGHKMMNEEQFLLRLYSGFGIAHASVHKTAMLVNLKKRLDNFLQESLPVVLIVDDAHLFSTKILGLILELASLKNQKTGSSLHVILASEPQIKILLAEPELDNKHNLIIRKIDLPALDELHTGNYLNHRLSQSGMEVEQFLTRKTISRIYKQSEGIPLQINKVADNILFDTTPVIRRTSNVQASKRNTQAKFMVITLLAIIPVVAFFYRDLSDLLFGDANKAADQTKNETVTPLNLPALKHQRSANPDSPIKPSGNSPLTPGSNSDKSLTTKTPASSTSKTEAIYATIPANPDIKPQQKKQTVEQTPENNLVYNPATKQESKDTPIITNKRPADGELNDASWILAQKPSYFTLQLVTGHQQKTIHTFIQKYQLSGPQLAYFQTQRAGKVWHNLTFGVYANRKLALAAIAQLPAELAAVKPWIRRLSSIQAEIQKSL